MRNIFCVRINLLLSLVMALIPNAAHAANSCAVDTAHLSLGGINVLTGTPVDTVGGPIQVDCTGDSGTVNLSIGINAGAGLGASEATRYMTLMGGAGGQLSYSLYSSSANRSGGVYWGSSGASLYTPSITVSNNSGSGSYSVYGRVFGGQQTARSGTYTDTLTITVSY